MWRLLSTVAVLAIAVAGLVVPVGPVLAAVAGDVVISEFMFDPLSGVDGDEFLELTNRTASPVDLSGWSFTGHHPGVPGRCHDRGQRLDRRLPGRRPYQATYGVTAAAVYTGGLSNGGETLTLKDASRP